MWGTHENGASQRQNLALTVLYVPYLLEALAAVAHRREREATERHQVTSPSPYKPHTVGCIGVCDCRRGGDRRQQKLLLVEASGLRVWGCRM